MFVQVSNFTYTWEQNLLRKPCFCRVLWPLNFEHISGHSLYLSWVLSDWLPFFKYYESEICWIEKWEFNDSSWYYKFVFLLQYNFGDLLHICLFTGNQKVEDYSLYLSCLLPCYHHLSLKVAILCCSNRTVECNTMELSLFMNLLQIHALQ